MSYVGVHVNTVLCSFLTYLLFQMTWIFRQTFFEYFLATYSILAEDPSLWCVSAWNDNGKAGMIDESESRNFFY